MNKILATTRFVVCNSNSVKINQEKVLEFSSSFNYGKVQHWISAAPFNFSSFSKEEKLHFLIILNALSFCYWGEPKWTIEDNGRKFDGAWGMIVALGREINERKHLLNFEYCSNISKDNFATILRGNIEIPLFEQRWEILRELGTIMVKRFNGKTENLHKEAEGDALKLLELIEYYFPSFQDVSLYKNTKIYFYKRAQLLIADIYQIFNGEDYCSLKNIEQLTACADYKIPQILRKLGILEYSYSLAEKIDRKIELDHNSSEEIEIRANTIWAIEFIKEEVKKHIPYILSFEINDYLWLATQKKFSNDKPYHRTITTAY